MTDVAATPRSASRGRPPSRLRPSTFG